jgi:putative hemolysin
MKSATAVRALALVDLSGCSSCAGDVAVPTSVSSVRKGNANYTYLL